MLITRVDSIAAYSLVLTLELKIVMISVYIKPTIFIGN